MVWTEIYSVIKGSPNSGIAGLTKLQYMDRKDTLLNEPQKDAIYGCYLRYRRWKDLVGAYDLMDVVNYALEELTVSPFPGRMPDMHYIMIDEVQDLCGATIKLLTKITENNVFCSGDSAQSIAKGVGFRFGTLRDILQSTNGSF